MARGPRQTSAPHRYVSATARPPSLHASCVRGPGIRSRVGIGAFRWVSLARAQPWIETKPRRTIGADDLFCDTHFEVDVRVIVRRRDPDAVELAAANAHDGRGDIIAKLRVAPSSHGAA